MEPIFTDAALQEEFARRGFTKARLLSREAAAGLGAAIEEARRGSSGESCTAGLDQSFCTTDADYRKRVDALGAAAIEQPLLALLRGYRLVASGAMIKLAGGSAMAIHRDRHVLADPEGVIVNAWCPLVDMAVGLGNLALLPGSHRLGNIETNGVHRFYEPYGDRLKPLCVSFPLEAGEAVLFDNRVLHWSHPNERQTARPVLRCVAAPAEGQLVFYRPDAASGGRRFELLDAEAESPVAHSPDDFVEGRVAAIHLGYVENTNREIGFAECRDAALRAEGLPAHSPVKRAMAAVGTLIGLR
jgi:hypothetical protein